MTYKAVASKDAEFQKTVQTGTAIVDVGFGNSRYPCLTKIPLVSTQNLILGVLRLQ